MPNAECKVVFIIERCHFNLTGFKTCQVEMTKLIQIPNDQE
jgi:hypothetical protein